MPRFRVWYSGPQEIEVEAADEFYAECELEAKAEFRSEQIYEEGEE